jgi:hypothetical protein
MSYAGPLAILFIVLSPLLIPVGVTAVHAMGGWRRRFALLHGVVRARTRAAYQSVLAALLWVSGAPRRALGENAISAATGPNR